MIRWWLRPGLDGFRLDMINSIYEDNQFRNNPLSWLFFPNDETTEKFFQRSQYTINFPETFKFAKEL